MATTTKAPTNRETYNKVFARIIENLETGNVEAFSKAWVSGLPKNATSGRGYNGGNVLALVMEGFAKGYTSTGWVTFNQAVKAGIVVRKGEKATPVYYMKKITVKDKNAPADAEPGEDGKTIFLARLYYVFNLDQCKDLEGMEGSLEKLRAKADTRFAHDPIEACETMVAETGATIIDGHGRAYYSPTQDVIGMPVRSSFKTAQGYYAVLFHELTHWTSKADRCNRDLSKGRFGNPEYAAEELVAELGAAFLAGRFGFDHVSQATTYLASWLKALKNDVTMLVTAASAAQKAVDFLAPSAEEIDAEEIEA